MLDIPYLKLFSAEAFMFVSLRFYAKLDNKPMHFASTNLHEILIETVVIEEHQR